MAILDFLKKDEQKTDEKAETVAVEPKKTTAKTKKSVASVKTEKKIGVEAYRILKAPHISEKATDLNQKDQYVFKVLPRAKKTEIKKVIENLYGVNVTGVKIIKVPAKKKRRGKNIGIKKGYKKAIVRIKKGEKIEILAQ
ncbi:MAG: 50S ribosomal protein L23 [bacterium]